MGHELRTCDEHEDPHAGGRGVHDDHHEHGLDHEDHASRWSRLPHPLTDLFGGHSHDTGDQVDQTLETHDAGRRALLISLAGLLVTAIIQAVVVALTGSVALLGDTLHNVADALTAIPLLIAFRLARRPANPRFTYGYGRA
jgi:Co/Zn/Cd efflux system component